jgi:hypothetical protein
VVEQMLVLPDCANAVARGEQFRLELRDRPEPCEPLVQAGLQHQVAIDQQAVAVGT